MQHWTSGRSTSALEAEAGNFHTTYHPREFFKHLDHLLWPSSFEKCDGPRGRPRPPGDMLQVGSKYLLMKFGSLDGGLVNRIKGLQYYL